MLENMIVRFDTLVEYSTQKLHSVIIYSPLSNSKPYDLLSSDEHEDILRNIFVYKMTVSGLQCWVHNVPQNISFCVPQKKEMHKGLEQHEGE